MALSNGKKNHEFDPMNGGWFFTAMFVYIDEWMREFTSYGYSRDPLIGRFHKKIDEWRNHFYKMGMIDAASHIRIEFNCFQQ